MFNWGVSHERVPVEAYQRVASVRNLAFGRSEARETEPVKPVPEEHINAVEEQLPKTIWYLIRLQLLTGARASEIYLLRPSAELILRERMGETPLHEYMFSPRKAIDERCSTAPTHRRANQAPTPRKTTRKVGECYTKDSYRNAITRACKKADVTQLYAEVDEAKAIKVMKEIG